MRTFHLQEERWQGDAWEDRISTWAANQIAPFTIGDVLSLCLDIAPKDWDRSAQTRVGMALARMGFETRGKTRPRVYWRGR